MKKESNLVLKTIIIGFFAMLLVTGICTTVFYVLMEKATGDQNKEQLSFERHYAFIADNAESDIWDDVYESAREYGLSQNVYVERFGELMNVEYNAKQLLTMAVNASVDGIIYYGGVNDSNTQEIINKAVHKNIPVVLLQKDIENSLRQSFVGVNSYELGRNYGEQILDIIDGQETVANQAPQKVWVLLGNNASDSYSVNITLAIQNTIMDRVSIMPDIEMISVDMDDTFRAEERIRSIFMSEDHPDILVCTNSIFTQCAYQAAVDYNLVGQVKILGYYATDQIIEAVRKQIVYSTVDVDVTSMGESCVEALQEYKDSGYTNSFISVPIKMIEKKEAEAMDYEN